MLVCCFGVNAPFETVSKTIFGRCSSWLHRYFVPFSLCKWQAVCWARIPFITFTVMQNEESSFQGTSKRQTTNSRLLRNTCYLKPYYIEHLKTSGQTVYEGISKSFEPNMERARNLDLFCFIFQRSPLPTPHTCPI